ncbi:ABC transporter ATP-binding protein [Flavobacterium sp. XS2P12]|uniref:ABC transporter ATP-binding protein n=1 Tax=Flavobacterium melibiosi TaxID=3398734 RepID=UPI003A899393
MKLEIKNISKQYSKSKFGLQNFSINIENGILGLLGPNGAGKSTLMKIIATISNPTSGQILLNGVDITKNPNRIREILGYLPQDFGVYPNLNAFEFLEYIGAMKGIGGPNLKTRISQLLEGVNLMEAAKKPIGTYSGGMKQRVGIAQVLLNDPKILIFDEPTVGLDPEERVRFRNLISDLANDAIIILSSHIVSDIETIADKVAIMQHGKLISLGYQQEIIDTLKNKVFEIEIDNNDLNTFKVNHLILNTIRKKDKILIRFIANEKLPDTMLCNATLEDAYLYQTKK